MSSVSLARSLDFLGVFVFAISGASLAVRRDYDIVGVAVLAWATGLGGGVMRDVLIADGPPAALVDQILLLVPLLAAAVVFFFHARVERFRYPVLVFDGAGLGLFAVSGAVTAAQHGFGVGAATVVGAVAAVGGGVVRDVLAREVPAVFRADSALYAIPAAAGAAAAATTVELDLYGPPAAAILVLIVFVFRMCSLRFEWKAPTAR